MLSLQIQKFLDASRFTSFTRPDPRTQQHLDLTAARHGIPAKLWKRRPYWL